MPSKNVTADITAQNSFTDTFSANGPFNIILAGTWAATVTLQMLRADGSTWVDVTTWTANAIKIGEAPPTGGKYRLGVKTGDFTSGTVNAELNQ